MHLMLGAALHLDKLPMCFACDWQTKVPKQVAAALTCSVPAQHAGKPARGCDCSSVNAMGAALAGVQIAVDRGLHLGARRQCRWPSAWWSA